MPGDVKTIRVRGEGGHVFDMDLPLPEAIAKRLHEGLLTEVPAEPGPVIPGPELPAAGRKAARR